MAFSDLMDQKLPRGLLVPVARGGRGGLLGGVAEGAMQPHLDPTEPSPGGRFG